MQTSILLLRGWNQRHVLTLISASVFYWLYYFVICKLPVVGIPTFRIDYLAATISQENLSLLNARPVSDIYVFIQAVLANLLLEGKTSYIIYPFQHVTLLIYFFCIARVVESLLKIKIHPFAFLAAWFLFATNPGVIEGVYKLESIVGTLSMFFGGLALFFLEKWDRDRNAALAIIAVSFYALSIFAKEDFILPPLLLLGWYLTKDGDWKRHVFQYKGILIALISLLVFFIIFNKYIIPHRSYMEPINKIGNPYFMILSPISIVQVIWQYMVGWGLHIKLLNFVYLFATLGVLIFGKNKKEVLFLALLALSMMGPYSIMPNHLFTYYGLKWWALEALTAFALLQMFFKNKQIIVTGVICGATLLFVMATINRNPSNFFRGNFAISQNIQNTLIMNRQAINANKQVAILGIGPGQIIHTPWQGNGETEFFLRGDMKVDTQWILFVKSEDDRYKIDESVHAEDNTKKRVVVKNIKTIEKYRNIPLITFNSDGQGIFQ